MHYYKASKAFKFKSLSFLIVILLLISPLILHHSSASAQQENDENWYDDWYDDLRDDYIDPYANCTSFPCPVPEYPPDNDCTLITAINPITNTTETSTYMITYNLPPGSTQEDCQKIIPNLRPEREGCKMTSCIGASNLLLCGNYNQEICMETYEVGEGEAWRCGGRTPPWADDAPWADESLCVCSPCGVVFKPALLGTAEREAKAKALVEVVVENRDVSVVVL